MTDQEIDKIVLAAIGFTEETNFDDLCEALGDHCPAKGDKAEWAKIWKSIRRLAEQRLLGAKWDMDRRFVGAQLTTAGRDRVQQQQK